MYYILSEKSLRLVYEIFHLAIRDLVNYNKLIFQRGPNGRKQ
jgi:hypothetical protein